MTSDLDVDLDVIGFTIMDLDWDSNEFITKIPKNMEISWPCQQNN